MLISANDDQTPSEYGQKHREQRDGIRNDAPRHQSGKWANRIWSFLILVCGGMGAAASAFIETDDYDRPLRNFAGVVVGAMGLLTMAFGGFALLLNL